jgi:hypothetical protein
MLFVKSFSKFSGVKRQPLTAGKNVMALSVNGLKMTSVRCSLKIKMSLNR